MICSKRALPVNQYLHNLLVAVQVFHVRFYRMADLEHDTNYLLLAASYHFFVSYHCTHTQHFLGAAELFNTFLSTTSPPFSHCLFLPSRAAQKQKFLFSKDCSYHPQFPMFGDEFPLCLIVLEVDSLHD